MEEESEGDGEDALSAISSLSRQKGKGKGKFSDLPIMQRPNKLTTDKDYRPEPIKRQKRNGSTVSASTITPSRKRSQDVRSPTNPEEEGENKPKKAKLDYATITSDPDLKSVGKLTKEVLMKKLGDCLELIHHQNDEILSRDAEVSRLKTEIVKMKLAFAEKTIQEYEKSQAVGKPSGLSSHISAARYLRPSYASIARSEAPPVLIAHLADGAGDEVIDIAKVDQLLDSKTNGPVPLHVKKKDNNLLITFNDGADLDRAADVIRSKSDCTSMFKSVSKQNVLFPMVALS